jgi:hypothetical protein
LQCAAKPLKSDGFNAAFEGKALFSRINDERRCRFEVVITYCTWSAAAPNDGGSDESSLQI